MLHTKLVLIAFLVLILCSCTSKRHNSADLISASESEEFVRAKPHENYVREDLLKEVEGKLFGNWQSSFSGACTVYATNIFIEKESVIEKEKIGTCSKSKKIIWLYKHH